MFQLTSHRFVLMIAVMFSTLSTASAQTVVYDWSSGSKTPESARQLLADNE